MSTRIVITVVVVCPSLGSLEVSSVMGFLFKDLSRDRSDEGFEGLRETE